MNLNSNDNPFEPSEIYIAPEVKSHRVLHSPLVLSIQWTVVVLVNLIVPCLLASSMTGPMGNWGIFLGVLLVLLLGYLASTAIPMGVLMTVRGGILVALSQFFPVLHIIAGLLSIEFYRMTGIIDADLQGRGKVGFQGALLLTVTTGGILLLVSCGLGVILRWITPNRWWLSQRLRRENEGS
ncbi:MAG: hypothetical protein NTV29_03195 [Planctomycetota bacterium]|nr:hypothetical protein [Planctomycetota bacterium]